MSTLIPGSFRGFAFNILSHKITGSNFVKEHNYLNTFANDIENQGSRPRQFSLTIVLSGPGLSDYHILRDAFIKRLDEPGSGELIHPHLGSLQVVVESYSHSNNQEEGIAQFEVSFKEVRLFEEDRADFQFEFKEVRKQFTVDAQQGVEENIKVQELSNDWYKTLENKVVSVLSFINDIKNSIEYSEFIEKQNSIIELTTNKENWTNIYEFFDNFLTFKNYSYSVYRLYKRLLNYNREYTKENDLPEEKKYKEQNNLIHEALKSVATGKIVDLIIEGEAPKSLKQYLITKIKESQIDLVIPGTYESLQKIKNFVSVSIEEEVRKTIEVLTPTPAILVALENGVSIDDIEPINDEVNYSPFYNINEVKGKFSVPS